MARTQALRAENTDEILRSDWTQVDLPLTKTRKTRRERFDEKVDRSGGPLACHPWTGSAMQGNGYGQFYDKGTMRTAHRVAYEMATGPIPEGMLVLHSRVCATPLCVNPRHLRLGTNRENADDRVAVGHSVGRKLTANQVGQIVRLRSTGLGNGALAERFGVNVSSIRDIFSGRTWSKVTGIPKGTKSPNRGRPPKLQLVEVDPPIPPASVLTKIVAATERRLQ